MFLPWSNQVAKAGPLTEMQDLQAFARQFSEELVVMRDGKVATHFEVEALKAALKRIAALASELDIPVR